MNQIEKRKEEYPDHVDQVPIESNQIDRSEIATVKASPDCSGDIKDHADPCTARRKCRQGKVDSHKRARRPRRRVRPAEVLGRPARAIQDVRPSAETLRGSPASWENQYAIWVVRHEAMVPFMPAVTAFTPESQTAEEGDRQQSNQRRWPSVCGRPRPSSGC